MIDNKLLYDYSVRMFNVYRKFMTTKADTKFENQFPIPISIEEFRQDILALYLHYACCVGQLTDELSASAFLKLEQGTTRSIFNPDYNAIDLGLNYEAFKSTHFVKAMESLYNFAYLGKKERTALPFEDGGDYTWMSAMVLDVKNSMYAAEWEKWGRRSILAPATRCVQVAETANARSELEGGLGFFNFQESLPQGDEEGLLTVRQLALLSGMEEMSVRAAANRNRANKLEIISTKYGSRIEAAEAKKWLISKNRYVPIIVDWSNDSVDLSTHRFTSEFDWERAVHAQFHVRCGQLGPDQAIKMAVKLRQEIDTTPDGVVLKLDFNKLSDEAYMGRLADVLDWPKELFILRGQELYAQTQLELAERRIRYLRDAQN